MRLDVWIGLKKGAGEWARSRAGDGATDGAGNAAGEWVGGEVKGRASERQEIYIIW